VWRTSHSGTSPEPPKARTDRSTASGQSWCTMPAWNVPWPATGSSGPVSGSLLIPPYSASSESMRGTGNVPIGVSSSVASRTTTESGRSDGSPGT
jgi:hypothetical protein